MTHFLRGKQTGIQRDFSAGLEPHLFAIDLVRSTLLHLKPEEGYGVANNAAR